MFCREVSRTEGISTTDLVGRMLLLTKNHFRQGEKEYAIEKEGLLAFLAHFLKNRRFLSMRMPHGSDVELRILIDIGATLLSVH